jgi:hypothetical protein
MAEMRRQWHGWRGSLDQLTRVFRAMVEEAEKDAASTPECRIEVEVKGDREPFSSPQQFLNEVTKEALQRFQRIKCTVNASSVAIEYEMAWQFPIWMPERSAEVTLLVAGEDSSRVEGAAQAVQAAVSRAAVGRWRHRIASKSLEMGMAGAVAFIAALALASVGAVSAWAWGAVMAFALAVGEYLRRFLYPDLEVKQDGKSRFARVRGFVWTLLVALIGTGLGKLIFGS